MESENPAFDDILSKIGEFGRYQVIVYNLICLFMLIPPWQHFVLFFLSGNTDHWCKIPEWSAVDCGQFGLNSSLECAEAKRQVGIPSNLSADGQLVFDQCHRYDVTGVAFAPDLELAGTATIPCEAGWDYAGSGKFTINQEFDVVCGSSYLISLSQSVYFAGTAIGSVFIGIIADRFGRKPALFLCLAVACVFGLIMAFSVNIWMFMIVRLFVGMAAIGVVTDSFILANEFIGISKRNIAGNVIWVHFALGYVTLTLLAYFINYWRHLQLVVALVPAALFPLYFLLPESPRWLLSKGRTEDASKLIRRISKINRVQFDDSFLLKGATKEHKVVDSEPSESQSFFKLFQRPRLRVYTVIIMLNIMVNTIVYYGLSLGTSSLGVNIYVAFAISGAVEVPAYLLIIYPIEYFGRRTPYVFLMLVSGIACLATTAIPMGPWRAVVALFGKFTITSSFAIVFLHACEIFPTPIRNSAFGVCRLFSFGSNVLCPIILLLSDYWVPLPLIIFGSLSIVAGGLAVLLPETRGKKMPETLDDAENIGWRGVPRSRHRGKSSHQQYESVEQDAQERVEDKVVRI